MKVAFIAVMLLTSFAVRSKALPSSSGRRETRNHVLLELLGRYLDDELENAKRTVEVVPEASEKYEDMKMDKIYKWYTFKVSSDQKKIVPDEYGVPSSYVGVDADKAAWDDLINGLPHDEPRYAVFNTRFIWNGVGEDEIVFVAWAPDGANIKDKMVYTSSKDYIKDDFNVEIELKGKNVNELSYDTMIAKVLQNL